jgi:hypothetical protein
MCLRTGYAASGFFFGNARYPGDEPAPFFIFPDYQQGAGIADRAVGTGNYTDEQHEDEIMYGGTSQQEQGKEDESDGEGGIQRPDKGFVDAEIDNLLEFLVGAFGHVFPDAVEDHDSVVHAVTGNSQHAGDKQRIDLNTEAQPRMENMPATTSRSCNKGDDRTDPPARGSGHLAERVRDIQHNENSRDNNRDDGVTPVCVATDAEVEA